MIPYTILIALLVTLIYFGYDLLKLYCNLPFNTIVKVCIDYTIHFILSFCWVNALFGYKWYGILIGILLSFVFGFIMNVKQITEILKKQ